MGKGGRPKREGKKPKKTAAKAVSLSSAGIVGVPEVSVIKKKRKPRDEEL